MSNHITRRLCAGIIAYLVACATPLFAQGVCTECSAREDYLLTKTQPVFKGLLSTAWSIDLHAGGYNTYGQFGTFSPTFAVLGLNYPGDWKSIALVREHPLSPCGLKALVFRIRGVQDNNLKQLKVVLRDPNGGWIHSAVPVTEHMVTTPDGTYNPDEWYTVVIPIEVLNPNMESFKGIAFMTGTLRQVYLSDIWFVAGLEFPLKRPGDGAYTTKISSVYDHHRTPILEVGTTSTYKRDNCADGIVMAYTGEVEVGNSLYGGDVVPASQNSCHAGVPLEGYMQESEADFIVGGQYSNGAKSNFLYYDGHTGYDYPAANGTPVYTVADGKVTLSKDYPYGGTVVIDHHNGYESHYLHMERRDVEEGAKLGPGVQVGTVGMGHLHYTLKLYGEQVDPYGWEGTIPDPAREYAVSIPLWK